MDTTIKDFEAAIAELETIVRKLEEGDIPLEASLQLYERGVQLSRFCHAQLEQAEKRIEILNERGELRPAPASLGEDAAGATGSAPAAPASPGQDRNRR
jgi:exodeoxyribonuclease VII small subunit